MIKAIVLSLFEQFIEKQAVKHRCVVINVLCILADNTNSDTALADSLSELGSCLLVHFNHMYLPVRQTAYACMEKLTNRYFILRS